MLRRIRDLEGATVDARDARDVGTVRDAYFDDERWTIRYIVVETGSWLSGRHALVSPLSVHAPGWERGRIAVSLTREQLEHAPSLERDRPISREYEARYAAYYGYPLYWAAPGPPSPATIRPVPGPPPSEAVLHARMPGGGNEERHVRSASEVSGYHVAAADGEIGHVEDFLCDEATWAIRYLTVDTSNWIGGRTVLVAPEWVNDVEWERQLVHVDVTREAVRDSPEYHPGAEVDAAYEERLREAYRRPVRPI